MHKPILLCILDGWGISKDANDNAISLADTPNYDRFLKNYPNSELQTSGLAVGLPDGQIGNSEVGHMTIGAGRVIFQDLPRINLSIESGELELNQYLQELVKNLQDSNKTCHLLGLVSEGGVHSSQAHIIFLAKFLAKNKVKVKLHAFLDGRDVAQKSALIYLKNFLLATKKYPHIQIATISGRYFAMDRDKNWDRIQKAYEAIVEAKGNNSQNAIEAVENHYKQNITDEFILPTIIDNYSGIKEGDALLTANFRADRIRQISDALLDPEFKDFPIKKINFSYQLALTEYSDKLNKFYQILFPSIKVVNSLPEIIAGNHLKQLRIAETEKYAHVTFFFSCGQEKEFEGENRILIQSPAVATYDLKPEMSARELTNQLVKAIKADKYDFIIVNYANPDMVGHSGLIEPSIKACEVIDEQLGILEKLILEKNSIMIISADHGNIECMKDSNNLPNTAHTTNPVPFILISKSFNKVKLKNGKLSDIAPTILSLMNINQPNDMNGKNLIY
jgi:2,3-bisphosphoglycerate-independent phosphoglycerate mutase